MVSPGNQIFDLLPGDINPRSLRHRPEVSDGIEDPYFKVVFSNVLGGDKPAGEATCLLYQEMRSARQDSQPVLLDPSTADGTYGETKLLEAPPLGTTKPGVGDGGTLQIPRERPSLVNGEDLSPLPEGQSQPAFATRTLQAIAATAVPGQPLRLPETGENVYSKLLLQSLDLEPGAHRILDSSLKGDVLHLTVAHDSDKSNVFSIAVPLEQLKLSMASRNVQIAARNSDWQDSSTDKQLKGGVVLSATRSVAQGLVERESFSGKELNLEQYLSRLNLKAIEIMPATKSAGAEYRAEPIVLTIIADDDGHKIAIRSYFFKKDLQIWREEGACDSKMGRSQRGIDRTVMGGNNAATNAQADPVTNAPHAFTKIAPEFRNQYELHDDFSFENLRTPGDRNESSSTLEKIETFTLFEKLTPDAEIGHRRLNIQPVRFTLPDNVKTALKPNGQTVMLRIEPEHLGPAKLSLTMYDDKLRARVVVNDIQAKIAVEGSLHRLVEQLSRANIEVDHIEVTVGGESARDGVLERHPRWRYRANRFGKFDFDGVFDTGRQAAAAASIAQPTSYVGADGVNLLA